MDEVVGSPWLENAGRWVVYRYRPLNVLLVLVLLELTFLFFMQSFDVVVTQSRRAPYTYARYYCLDGEIGTWKSYTWHTTVS